MKEIRIWLDDDVYSEVKEIVTKKNMSMSEYYRDLQSKQSGIELVIDFADIDKFVQEIEEIKKKIDTVLPTIYRTGKIYEQEAILLKQLLNQIDTKCDDIWNYITSIRSNLYNDVRKKLYKVVNQNGYKRRRTKKIINELEIATEKEKFI